MLNTAKPQRRLNDYGCSVWVPACAGTTFYMLLLQQQEHS